MPLFSELLRRRATIFAHHKCGTATSLSAMPLTAEDVASIATVENYIHDEQQAYLMLYGEGLFI